MSVALPETAAGPAPPTQPKLPQRARTFAAPAEASPPALDLLDLKDEQTTAPTVAGQQPASSSYDSVASGADYYTPIKTKKARSTAGGLPEGLKRWLIPVSIAASLVVLVTVFFTLGGFGRDGTLSKASSKISQILRFDSAEKIREDVHAQALRIEDYGLALRDSVNTREATERLLSEIPVFQDLVSRGANLSIEHLTAEEILELNEKVAAERDQWASMTNEEREKTIEKRSDGPSPLNQDFWRPNFGGSADAVPVDDAISRLAGWLLLAGIMPNLAKSYPSPMDDPPIIDSWTEKDRRNLAALHIASELNRDFYRALAAKDLSNLADARLDDLNTIIDNYTAQARELAQTMQNAGKVSTIIERIPRATPYEKFVGGTKSIARAFELNLRDELQANPQLRAVLSDREHVSLAIEDLILSPKLDFSGTSRERCAAFQQQEAERIAREESEETARIASEKAAKDRRERERIASAAREEADRIKRDEEAAKRREEAKKRDEEAARARQQMRDALGPQRTSPRDRFRNRPGGDGFGGNGSENTTQSKGNAIALPPGTSNGPRTPRDRGQRPPSDPAKLVTINVTRVSRITSRSVIEQAPQKLRSYGLSVSSSGGTMTIKIHNYDRPLDTLAELLPDFEFQSIDEESRTIGAIEKPE